MRRTIPLLVVSLALMLVAPVGAVAATTKNEDQQLAITGAPGYFTYTGRAGLPLVQGGPWGRPCQPIVFALDDNMPALQLRASEQAILNARRLGLDVTYATPEDHWSPSVLYPPGQTDNSVQVVNVFSSSRWPSPLLDGHPEHVGLEWYTQPAGDDHHEVLTDLEATLYIRAVGQNPQTTARTIRQLIAFSQGVSGSTASGSSVATGNHETAYTKNDVIAMERMSGCTLEPTSTPGSIHMVH